jgi:2-C-methyl-D-erythritol 2,4-cyclodiphosphate synthase
VRVGIGYDSHRLVAGRKLILGGVEVPHTHGLEGWSDADVVCHAITDAVLGAASLGDIGRMFPPSDPRWHDAHSLTLLAKAHLAAVEYGLHLHHADVTIVAEEPHLGPYLAEMEVKLAEALVAGATHVSVKAKTNDGMGFIGRGEGIAALAVVLLDERGPRQSSSSVLDLG